MAAIEVIHEKSEYPIQTIVCIFDKFLKNQISKNNTLKISQLTKSILTGHYSNTAKKYSNEYLDFLRHESVETYKVDHLIVTGTPTKSLPTEPTINMKIDNENNNVNKVNAYHVKANDNSNDTHSYDASVDNIKATQGNDKIVLNNTNLNNSSRMT